MLCSKCDFLEAYTIETYDGYTFFAHNIYSTSDTGLYLIKDSEVYTLADAYNLNIIDIKEIYDSLPKENYNGKLLPLQTVQIGHNPKIIFIITPNTTYFRR